MAKPFFSSVQVYRRHRRHCSITAAAAPASQTHSSVALLGCNLGQSHWICVAVPLRAEKKCKPHAGASHACLLCTCGFLSLHRLRVYLHDEHWPCVRHAPRSPAATRTCDDPVVFIRRRRRMPWAGVRVGEASHPGPLEDLHAQRAGGGHVAERRPGHTRVRGLRSCGGCGQCPFLRGHGPNGVLSTRLGRPNAAAP